MSGPGQSIDRRWIASTVGSRLARGLTVTSVISQGTAGGVVRVQDSVTSDAQCLIMLGPDVDEDGLQSVKQEVAAFGSIQDETLFGVTDLFRDNDINAWCGLMPMALGLRLSMFTDGQSMEVEGVLPLLRRLAKLLGAAHKVGVIHQHLTPETVTMPNGAVRRAAISGFGFGAVAPSLSDPRDGSCFAYLAPEQLDAFGDRIGTGTDIYALGLIAAAVSRGAPLDMGQTYSEAVQLRQSVPELRGVPELLVPLLTWMLQPHPQDRPTSMAQVVDGIARITVENAAELSPLRVVDGGHRVAERAEADTVDRSGRTQTARTNRIRRGSSPNKVRILGTAALPFVAFLGLVGGVGGYLSQNPDVFPLVEEPGHRAGAVSTPDVPATDVVETSRSVDFSTESDEKAVRVPDEALRLETPALSKQTADGPLPETNPPQTELALLAPRPDQPETVQPPVIIPDPVDQRTQWLRDYDTGPCTYHNVTELNETSLTLAAFGRDPSVYRTLMTEYDTAFGIEPDIVFQPISAPQCAVLDFLASRPVPTNEGVQVNLADDTVRSGDHVSGTLTGLTDRNLWVSLVDPQGTLVDLTRFVRRVGQADAQFDFAVTAQSEPQATSYLILALVSGDDLSFTETEQGAISSKEAFQVIERRLRLSDTETSLALKYFRLE